MPIAVPTVKQRSVLTEPVSPSLGSPAAPTGAFGEKSAAATEQVGEDMQVASANLGAAWQRVKEREASVNMSSEFNNVRSQMREMYNAELLAGTSFGNTEIVKQFRDNIRQLGATAIKNHKGTATSSVALQQNIDAEIARLEGASIGQSIKTNTARVMENVGADVTELAEAAASDPRTLNEQFAELEARMERSYKNSLDDETFKLQVKAGKAEITKSAINSVLLRGTPASINEAATSLLDPAIQEVLGAAGTRELTNKVFAVQKELNKPGKWLDVADETSSTKVRKVPEAVARHFQSLSAEEKKQYPEGVAKTPLIVNTQETSFQKEMGTLEAKQVNEFQTAATSAHRDLDDIARMKLAIQSNKFEFGTLASTRVLIGRVFETFNLPGREEVEKTLGASATADVFDGAANRMMVGAAKDMGRITNMTIQFIKDSFPALFRTREGNEILIQVMENVANRKIELGDLANSYKQFGTLTPTQEQWNKSNMAGKPLMSFYQAQKMLESERPVVDNALRERIMANSQTAPKTIGDYVRQSLPAGVPEGSKFLFNTKKGDKVYEAPDGKKYTVTP